MSRQAKVNLIGMIIAVLGFVVLGIAYSRGGLIMIYVSRSSWPCARLGCGTGGSGKPRRRPKFKPGPSNCALWAHPPPADRHRAHS